MGLDCLVLQAHQAYSCLRAFTLVFFMEHFFPSRNPYVFLPSSIKVSVQMSVPQKVFPAPSFLKRHPTITLYYPITRFIFLLVPNILLFSGLLILSGPSLRGM